MIGKHDYALLRPLPDGSVEIAGMRGGAFYRFAVEPTGAERLLEHRPLERFGLYRARRWLGGLFGIGVFALLVSSFVDFASIRTLLIGLLLVGVGVLWWVVPDPGYSSTEDLVENREAWEKVGGSWATDDLALA